LMTKEKKTPKDTSNKQEYNDQKKEKTLKNKLSNLEAAISKLEREILHMDEMILQNHPDVNSKPDFFKKYDHKKRELNQKMKDWEEVQIALEA